MRKVHRLQARAQAQERLDEIELAFALGFARPVALQLAEPMTIPAGSQLHCVAHFDNSENNRNNPNPNATVRWGEQTWDEMLIGYFDIAVPRAVLDTAAEVNAKPDDPKAAARREQLGKVLRDLDKNKDGKITLNEVPEPLKPLFKRIDTNKDGTLSIDEVRQAIQASKASKAKQ